MGGPDTWMKSSYRRSSLPTQCQNNSSRSIRHRHSRPDCGRPQVMGDGAVAVPGQEVPGGIRRAVITTDLIRETAHVFDRYAIGVAVVV